MSNAVVRRAFWAVVALALISAATAWATPPVGFIVNQILASGFIPGGFSQHIRLKREKGSDESSWKLRLYVKGDTDHHQQQLVLIPGGYSGWHSHPGLLIATVKAGQIDLYDAECNKRTVKAGEVYTENDQIHGIINTGLVDAELYITYLVKHGLPRRQEAPAPECAPVTGIP